MLNKKEVLKALDSIRYELDLLDSDMPLLVMTNHPKALSEWVKGIKNIEENTLSDSQAAVDAIEKLEALIDAEISAPQPVISDEEIRMVYFSIKRGDIGLTYIKNPTGGVSDFIGSEFVERKNSGKGIQSGKEYSIPEVAEINIRKMIEGMIKTYKPKDMNELLSLFLPSKYKVL